MLQPEEDAECLKYGFGFTDVAKTASGMDRAIPKQAWMPRNVHRVLEVYRPRALVFNGKKAAQMAFAEKQLSYGLWRMVETTNIWVMPSTSGAAQTFWSIDPWREMAQSLRQN